MIKGNDLGKDSILRLVINLAIPAMIAQLVNVLYSIIDRMYIGHIPEIGNIALAGIGVCGPIVTLLSSFGTLVGIGGSILVAMSMGEGDNKKAEDILANSFLLLIIFSGVLTIVFLILKEKLIIWFGASDVTFQYANTYLTIYTAGTFFALMALGLNYFINCQGFAFAGMCTVVIGAISNIILDAVFIFGFNLGVAGAAYATVIAQMISFIFAIAFMYNRKVKIKIKFRNYSLGIIKKILSIGMSPFIILATDSFIIIAMNSVLQRYGGPEQGDFLVSCVTIVQSYFLLITGPLIGISGGTQALISYNYGAGDSKRVKKSERFILLIALIFTTSMFLISQFLPQVFIRLFTDVPDYIEFCTWGIKVFTLGVIPMAFQYVFVDGLTALGRVKTALTLSLTRKGLYVVSTLMLPIIYSATSAFYAQPIADITSATITTVVFLLIFNKHLQKRVEKIQNT
ncbi:MAG: MATE family efflux transporter [Clostridium sp.]|nr:MATE family efflux transporter [Clostridium sp.]